MMVRKAGESRPRPLLHESTWVGIASAAGVIGAAVGVVQVEALANAAPEIIASLAAGGVLASNRITALRGEKHVTPVDSPRDNEGRKLGVVDDGIPPV